MGPPLEPIPGQLEQVTADGEPINATIVARSTYITVVIPPSATSTADPRLRMNTSRHDIQVRTVAALGRLGWHRCLATSAAR